LEPGPYGATYKDPEAAKLEIEKPEQTADAATALNAGHDLTVSNLPPLLARVPSIAEVSYRTWVNCRSPGVWDARRS